MLPAAAVAEVKKAYESGRKRYSTINLSFDDYLARVQDIVAGPPAGSGDDWHSAFSKLQHEDLYLALACARGDRIAWEYFADDYLAMLRKYAGRACGNPADADDLAQQLLARLMEDGSRIGGYNGRGSLAAWLRISVAHAAIDRFRRTSKEVPLEAVEESGLSPAQNEETPPEERLDRRWGPVLCEIVTEEIRKVSARDRLLLGLYYLQSVPLRMIGRHFRVHEATASRWLDGLRRNLRKNVERELNRRYGLKGDEIQSLWAWASGVDGFSLEKVLGEVPRLDLRTKGGAGS